MVDTVLQWISDLQLSAGKERTQNPARALPVYEYKVQSELEIQLASCLL